MSVLDKIAATLTPPESQEDRANARQQARSLATPGEWLAMVLDHHEQIERCFADVKAASPADRPAAQKRLGILLTGHSIAEESVLYPAMVENDEKAGAAMAVTEQAAAKTQMAMLEKIDPATQDYEDKLEHIRGAVAHHMYEEEGTWFARLKQNALQADQALLTKRFAEEYDRYVGQDNSSDGSSGFARGNDKSTDAYTVAPYNGLNESMADTQTTPPMGS